VTVVANERRVHSLHICDLSTVYIFVTCPQPKHLRRVHSLHICDMSTTYTFATCPQPTYLRHVHSLHICDVSTAYIFATCPQSTHLRRVHSLHICDVSTVCTFATCPQPTNLRRVHSLHICDMSTVDTATVQVSHALITIFQCLHPGSHDTHTVGLFLLRRHLGNWPRSKHEKRTVGSAWETRTVAAADGVRCARARWEINFLLTFETAPFFCVYPVY